jgi:translation initiation factor 3 subunit C
MSRFFAASDSSSEESSEEELYSNAEESEEEKSDKDSDDDDDSSSGSEAGGANRFLKDADSESDSDEDDGAKVLKSGKDKRFDELEATIRQIENAQKINDWAVISDRMSSLGRLVKGAGVQWRGMGQDNEC